jgi:hypothetical protein
LTRAWKLPPLLPHILAGRLPLVDEAAKQVVAFDLRVGQSSGCVPRFRRDERERRMPVTNDGGKDFSIVGGRADDRFVSGVARAATI